MNNENISHFYLLKDFILYAEIVNNDTDIYYIKKYQDDLFSFDSSELRRNAIQYLEYNNDVITEEKISFISEIIQHLKKCEKNKIKYNKYSSFIYLIVSYKDFNHEIVKIGGSSSKYGPESTLSFYITALHNNSGPSRFILNRLMYYDLLYNRTERFLFYIKFLPNKKEEVFGFNTIDIKNVNIDYKPFEFTYLEDYKKIFGYLPKWNFQERHESYPSDIYEEFMQYKNQYYKK